MKQLYYVIAIFSLFCLSGCLEDLDMNTRLQNALKPEFEKFSGDDITKTATTIVAKATLTKENGSPVTERGFKYWKEKEESKVFIKKDDKEEGKGTYTLPIERLDDNARYSLCPYATNGVGTGYGDTISVNTNRGVGRVKTSEVDDEKTKATSAEIRAVIKEKGEGNFEDYGFRLFNAEKDTVYGKAEGVELKNDSILVYTIKDLKPNTDYHVEAFVNNQFGEFSSDGKVTFKTKDGRPELGSISLKGEAGYDFANLRAELICEGDSVIKEFGFCWGTEKSPGRPNIEQDDTVRSVIIGEDNFFEATINHLNAATNYYVIAFATNAFGTRYSNDTIRVVTKRDLPTIFLNDPSTYIKKDGVVTIGGELQSQGKTPVTGLAIYYSSSSATPGPTNCEGKKEFTTADLDENHKFTIVIDSIKGGKKYYVVAYATNESGTVASNEIKSFDTPPLFTTITIDKNSFPGKDGRQGFGLFVINEPNLAFIVGGNLGNECTDKLYAYSPNNKWVEQSSYPGKGIEQMSVCTNGSTTYVLGGKSGSTMQKACYSYEFNRWSQITTLHDDMLSSGAISFLYKDSIILLGGTDAKGVVCDTIHCYDIWNKVWKGSNRFQVPITGGVALSTGDSVFVGLGDVCKERGWWMNSTGDWSKWTELAVIPSEMGAVSSGIIKGNDCFFIDNKGVIWQYKIMENKWYKRSTFVMDKPSVAPDYKMFILDNTIYIFGMNTFSDVAFRTYDPLWDIAVEQN